MDNIGGISELSYCFASQADYSAILKNGIKISLTGERGWRDLHITPARTEIIVLPMENGGEVLYAVSGSIYIPYQRKIGILEQLRINNRKILIKYKTNNGDIFVIGDKENPLKALVENVVPVTPSGYSGQKITISGTMKHAELPLI